jgi:predicted GNAT superfamily acetyltransferase
VSSVIRPVVESDLPVVLALNNDAVPAVNALEHADLSWFVAVAHSFLVQSADDGSIGGFVIGLHGPGLAYESLNYAWFSSRYVRFVYVDRIVVAASGRGAGVGRGLYDAFSARGLDDGHDVLLAEVNLRPRNDGSLRFHDRYGFRSVGEQDTEGGTKRVAMLEKRLDG